MIFFLVYGPLNLLREGHKFPCKVNLRLLTVTLIFLVISSESNKTQQAWSRQKLLLWRHQQTLRDVTRLQLLQGPDLKTLSGQSCSLRLWRRRGAKEPKLLLPCPMGGGFGSSALSCLSFPAHDPDLDRV